MGQDGRPTWIVHKDALWCGHRACAAQAAARRAGPETCQQSRAGKLRARAFRAPAPGLSGGPPAGAAQRDVCRKRGSVTGGVIVKTSVWLGMVTLVGLCSLAPADDWTRFRGPDASGVSSDTGTPVRWSQTERLVWKSRLPGAGASSPIIWKDKIFLTAYSGYGLDVADPGNPDDLRLHMVCVNRTTGQTVWSAEVEPRLPEQRYDAGFIRLHGYASNTPTTDGERVYAFFGRSGVVAFSMDGQVMWKSFVGDGTHNWGSGTSPILFEDLVIVNASVESGSIVALDKRTGREVWRTHGIRRSWSTPLVVKLASGPELVVSLHGKILGLDPRSGQQLWECDGIPDYVCPAVIAHEGVVFITGGRSPLTIAVRAGGRGDVTATHMLWRLRKTPKVATPLYYEGLLYWIDQRGVATCADAQTGKLVYAERLSLQGRGDKVYASLVYADGKLYGVSRQDGAIVMALGPQFKVLARNHLGDPSVFNATPAVCDGRLFVRSDRYLYCIGR
ncbi:MAG TPA: serine/threonine protein kinase [Planctomycetes bacterium]|nr:serine/threonine protein kinase [Planctomycetota bacterium]